jgi:glucosamine 6-phosphate synthetase-like amidotransferase/phosphosugar isomerase protein
MYLEIGLVILGIILILLVISYIFILLKILRTSKDITITLQTLNQSLPTILKNLEEITTNINNSTAAVNRRIQNFSNSEDRSQLIITDIIDNIQCVAPIVMKLPIFQTIRNVAAVIKGIRVFIDVLLNKKKV